MGDGGEEGKHIGGETQNFLIHFAAEENTSWNYILATHSKRTSPGVCDLWQGGEMNFSFLNLSFVLELEKQPSILPQLWILLIEAAKKFLFFKFLKKEERLLCF